MLLYLDIQQPMETSNDVVIDMDEAGLPLPVQVEEEEEEEG